MNRRGFIGALVSLPVAVSLPKGWLGAAAPVAPLTYGDIGARTAAWAARDMLRHLSPVLMITNLEKRRFLRSPNETVRFKRPASPFGDTAA